MKNLFEDDYNLTNLKRIRVKGHEFDLFVTPRFIHHYTSKAYEALTAFIVCKRARDVHTFIDVGAHYGFFDVLVGRQNPNCRILAFEPIPENYEILKKNLELNGIQNIQLFQAAVSCEEKNDQFQVSEASDNSGFVANPDAKVLKHIKVKVVPLDKFIEQIPNKPTLIKMDTEGSEGRVIRGMEKLIQRVDDIELIIEFNPKCLRENGIDPKMFLQQITDLGFSIFFIHDDNSICEEYDSRVDWTEFVEDKGYKNLYCMKKSNIERKGLDAGISILTHRRKKIFMEQRGTENINALSTLQPSVGHNIRKILFVNHNLFPFEISGTPLSTRDQALGMAQRGLQVAVLIPSLEVREGFRKTPLKDFTLYQVPALKKYEAFFALAGEEQLSGYQSAIHKIIDDFLPQVVHINDYVYMPAEIIGIFSCRGCFVIRNVCNCEELCYRDYPVISSGLEGKLCIGPESPSKCANCFTAFQKTPPQEQIAWDSFGDIEKKIESRFEYIRSLYQNVVDKVVFTSEPFKNYFTRFVPIPEDKIKVILGGVEFDFKRDEIKKKELKEAIHFGFVGNIMFSKGIDVVLKAFEKICEDNNFVLCVYGEIVNPEYLIWMEKLHTRYPNKFKYQGGFRPKDLPQIASNTNVVILPSYFDTYNRVVREFLYLGIPVIATDFFGAFIVEDGKNGFKIPVGDVDTLAEKMIEIIHRPSIIKDLSRGAEQTRIPSLQEEVDQLIQTYNDLYCQSLQKEGDRVNKKGHPFKHPKRSGDKPVRLIAFYLPQFHPIPENDRFWGKGFTEWTNVTKARPLFENHYQPHLPADLGFYDLRLPEVREAQANLAKEYGIYGFCYYHYWFKGKRLLERPFEEVLRSGKPEFPFCLCWANENWTRAWDGQDREVLLKQEYSEEDDLHHIRWLTRAFRDNRYIRIDGKPVILIYKANLLPNPARTAEIWRNEARRLGIGELYLCRVESNFGEHNDPQKIGFDAAVEFQPDWTNLGKRLLDHPAYERHAVFRYEEIVERMLKKGRVSYKRFPCVTPSWDNSARRKSGACIFIESNPDLYERWLREILEKFQPPTPEENLVFINAWNEWAEGNHLEPDQRFGRGYLEATRRALWRVGLKPDFVSSEDIYKDCLSLIDNGREDEAILGLNKFLTYEPNHPQAHNDLGVLYFRKGEYEKSCWYLERAIELAPKEIEFRINLADLYLESNQIEKAMTIYEQVLAINPVDVDVLIKMAHCHFQSECAEEGFYYLKRALDTEPGNKVAKEYLERLIGPKEKINGVPIQEEKRSLETPKVSIILPVFNNLNLIQKCLKSILQNSRDVDYEIIVVDDASTDGTMEFLSRLKNTLVKTISKNYRSGFIEACRSGAKIASGEYLLFLNQYTEVCPGWLTSLLQFAESNPDCGAVGSKLVCLDGRPQEAGNTIFSHDHRRDDDRGRTPSDPHYHFPREVDYCAGGALMVRRSLWNEIGGFNQHYSPAYYEDTDFCMEVRKRGFKVFYHLYQDSTLCAHRRK